MLDNMLKGHYDFFLARVRVASRNLKTALIIVYSKSSSLTLRGPTGYTESPKRHTKSSKDT